MGQSAAANAAIEEVLAVGHHGKRGLCARKGAAIQDPRRVRSGQVALDAGEGGMLCEVGVVCNGLLGSQEGEMVDSAVVVRIALAIVAILQDDAQTVEFLHQDLDDAGFEVAEAAGATGLTADVEEHRTSGLIVGRIKVVALFEGAIGMRPVPVAVRKVVDGLVNGMSRISGGLGLSRREVESCS